MPTYEYECKKCGYEFEKFHSMKDDPIKDCPECKGTGCVQRLIGCGAGIIFKGTGFYETDYKRKSNSSSVGTDRSSSTETKTKTETKSTTTSENKSKKDTGGSNGSVNKQSAA